MPRRNLSTGRKYIHFDRHAKRYGFTIPVFGGRKRSSGYTTLRSCIESYNEQACRQGLPCHPVPDDELTRLDDFVEQHRATGECCRFADFYDRFRIVYFDATGRELSRPQLAKLLRQRCELTLVKRGGVLQILDLAI